MRNADPRGTATQHYAMLRRNLLYTGLTRGRRLVVLVGQKKAVAMAVRSGSGRRKVVETAGVVRLNPTQARRPA
jgi:ATP-dependent exoDNAse (exonuclease V) alpha subunit